ncbi:hypothetical protein N9D87_00445 [bacterium]|nr:hypothetical protein [bacterium]
MLSSSESSNAAVVYGFYAPKVALDDFEPLVVLGCCERFTIHLFYDGSCIDDTPA